MCRDRKPGAGEDLSGESLLRVIGAFKDPAFLVTREGIVIHANESAKKRFEKPPDWLSSVQTPEGALSVQRIARVCRLETDDQDLWLVLPNTVSILKNEETSSELWKNLPPSLQRVAKLIILGFSDKEIADCTELTLSSVRTYTGRIYRKLGISGRQELMAQVLAAGLSQKAR